MPKCKIEEDGVYHFDGLHPTPFKKGEELDLSSEQIELLKGIGLVKQPSKKPTKAPKLEVKGNIEAGN